MVYKSHRPIPPLPPPLDLESEYQAPLYPSPSHTIMSQPHLLQFPIPCPPSVAGAFASAVGAFVIRHGLDGVDLHIGGSDGGTATVRRECNMTIKMNESKNNV